jgi:hypothetical protein
MAPCNVSHVIGEATLGASTSCFKYSYFTLYNMQDLLTMKFLSHCSALLHLILP